MIPFFILVLTTAQALGENDECINSMILSRYFEDIKKKIVNQKNHRNFATIFVFFLAKNFFSNDGLLY
jgi:hypothetical protein